MSKNKNNYIASFYNSWIELASKVMLNKKIINIRHMSVEESESMGWTKIPMVITLDDGTEIWAQNDDEGNNGGALALYNSNKKGKSFFTVLPTINKSELV